MVVDAATAVAVGVDPATAVAIALLTAVTIATRLLGPMIMRVVGAPPRVEAFLEAMSVSVLAALVATIVAVSGPREWVAVGVAAVVAVASRSAIWAMFAAVAVAATWTASVP
ncbi:AzlD domain-containing protein [Acuticoccus sp.]|uniref:AzlD domain-containing protein n=1 Tax=Acuticoccus sp. TaxID=1904378 RepID=UPI003B529374